MVTARLPLRLSLAASGLTWAAVVACNSTPLVSQGGSGGTSSTSSTGGGSPSVSSSSSELPAFVDHAASKYFPPVGDQGAVGACDWFAAVYAQMTFSFNRALDRGAAADTIFSPKFGYNILNNGRIYPDNIRLPDVYEFVMRHGSATMAEFPYDMASGTGYTEWCTDPSIWHSALRYRIQGYEHFDLAVGQVGEGVFGDVASFLHEVKRVLAAGEILVFQTNPDPAVITLGTTADDPATTEDDALVGQHVVTRGVDGYDHTMALVGYDDRIWVDLNGDGVVQASEKGALKIADSFGENVPYENKGFLWLAYGTLEESIYLRRFYRMKLRADYHPRTLARIAFSHPERDKLKFQFGRSTSADASTVDATRTFDPYGLGFGTGKAGVSLIAGAAIPLDGGFAFDLTDIDTGAAGPFYFRIRNDSDLPLTIRSFEVEDTKAGKITSDSGLPVTVGRGETFRFL